MNLDIIERAQAIRTAASDPDRTIKQRMARAAQDLSLAGYNQSRVETLNEACLALTRELYTVDPDGRLANVDNKTYRILIAKPWGKGGWKRWEMRDWEATVLRKILMMRAEMRRVAPLFDYGGGQWFLNLTDYPRIDIALIYWKQQPIHLRDWHLFADILRQDARERMDKRRGKK